MANWINQTKEENLAIVKKIAKEITDLRGSDLEALKEDETFEVLTNNTITGCNIDIDDLRFTVGRFDTGFEIYASNQRNGECGTIEVVGDVDNLFNLMRALEIDITFYSCSPYSIGKFYKPNNGSALNSLDDNDQETLTNLLEFLCQKGVITGAKLDYNNFEQVIEEWNDIKI